MRWCAGDTCESGCLPSRGSGSRGRPSCPPPRAQPADAGARAPGGSCAGRAAGRRAVGQFGPSQQATICRLKRLPSSTQDAAGAGAAARGQRQRASGEFRPALLGPCAGTWLPSSRLPRLCHSLQTPRGPGASPLGGPSGWDSRSRCLHPRGAPHLRPTWSRAGPLMSRGELTASETPRWQVLKPSEAAGRFPLPTSCASGCLGPLYPLPRWGVGQGRPNGRYFSLLSTKNLNNVWQNSRLAQPQAGD